MPFTEIEGHDNPVTVLKRAIANNTLAHAYLFSGDAGIGKKKTALALAEAVNCPSAGEEGGCGTCPSCRRIAAYTHSDVHMIMPESENEQLLSTWTDKEIEKASSVIKIDQIRQAQESISLRPSEGSKKLMIVDNAETLNEAAQNAFLKTLEEPPGATIIIMISAMPQKLLPTIRSRCQEVRFHPLPRRTLAQALLRRNTGLSEQDAWFLAALAQGSMGRGLEMDPKQERAIRDEVVALWDRLATMSMAEILAEADTLSKDRDWFERLLDIGIEWLRDVLVYRETGNEQLLVRGEALDRQREWGERFPLPRILADLELFTTSRRMFGRKGSEKLVAENLLLKLGTG